MLVGCAPRRHQTGPYGALDAWYITMRDTVSASLSQKAQAVLAGEAKRPASISDKLPPRPAKLGKVVVQMQDLVALSRRMDASRAPARGGEGARRSHFSLAFDPQQ